MNRWLWVGLIASVSCPLAAGCSGNTSLFGDPGPGGTGGTGASTSTTPTGSGAQGGAGNATSSGGTGGTGGGACVPEAVGVDLRDLDMIIMVDRSGSMGTPPKWNHMVAGVSSFAQESRPPGTRVALNYHPELGPPPGAECDTANYNPPDVPLTAIPADGAVIAGDISGETPNGMSPWSSIVEGTLQFATAHQAAEPEHVVVAVLIVDSDPNVCDVNIANVAAHAANAHSATGVRTFGIAFPDVTVANVTAVASAGQTGGAIDLTPPGATAQLQDALNEIHRRAVPCAYEIPASPLGPLEPDEVNLSYTPGGTATPEDIPRVSGEPACGSTPGWYYDNPASPTMILLCPASCDAIKDDIAPQVEVMFGCPTIEG